MGTDYKVSFRTYEDVGKSADNLRDELGLTNVYSFNIVQQIRRLVGKAFGDLGVLSLELYADKPQFAYVSFVMAGETKPLVRGNVGDAMELLDVEREMKTSYYVVKALTREHMKPKPMLNPTTRHVAMMVDRKDFERSPSTAKKTFEDAARAGAHLIAQIKENHPTLCEKAEAPSAAAEPLSSVRTVDAKAR